MRKRTSRGYGWGRRILLAATLAATSALLVASAALAGPSPEKYIW
jgi:hypothetical protein